MVDMGQQSCSCRKWEVTGLPCKHAIVAIWEMRKNNEHERILDHGFTIHIGWKHGRRYTPKTLLPPKLHVQVGRPKKKRKKPTLEVEDIVKGNMVSRAYKSVTCSKCSKIGHNSWGCKGQTDGGPQSSDV